MKFGQARSVPDFMEIAANITKILSDLGFSFWQLLILLIVLMFKEQIRALIAQVQNIKFAGSEISMRSGPSGKAQAVEKMKELKADLENVSEDSSSSPYPENTTEHATAKQREVSGLKRKLDSYLQETVLNSIKHIRDNTSFLWPEMRNAKINTSHSVQIRLSTYNRIYDDLQILKSEKLIDFSVGGDGRFSDASAVLDLAFTLRNPEMAALIEKAEHD